MLARSETTRAGDSPDSLLRRLGARDPAAAVFLRVDPLARALWQGRAGKLVQARVDQSGILIELVARYPAEKPAQLGTHFTRLAVARIADRWHTRVEQVPLESSTRLGSGTIRSSLFAATDEARIPDAVATQLSEIFGTDIDFHRELRKGDTFSVIYEALTADGEPIAWGQVGGRVLAAEFVNQGRSHQAVWFAPTNGRGAYYGFDGLSKRHAFLASPLEFSRVTSGFALRFHPLLNKWRAHLGVDYGAPSGTAVRAVGDGVVEMAGRQGGYGNVVQIRHSQERSTLYAHLSSIAVKVGERVEQAQNIGAVGSTGWATGPHLHFEFRVNGTHEDPLNLAKASDAALVDEAAKPRFALTLRTLKGQLQVAASAAGGRGLIE